MLKKLVTVAATTAALFVGVVAMSGAAEARPWHHGWRDFHHGHGHMFVTPFHKSAHCVWRHRWHHGRPMNVRVCRAVYW